MMMLKLILFVLLLTAPVQAVEVSFTVDDPRTNQSPIYSPLERNEKILEAFDRYHIKGALFVCGMRVNDLEGRALLQSWDDRSHLIANHTQTHPSLNNPSIPIDAFEQDVLDVELQLVGLKNFTKLFRFPYLKEGDTFEKRDGIRSFLKKHGYKNGYVTIDASDWYIEERMLAYLKKNPKADVRDLEKYKDYYLDHMWDRAKYYDDLSKKVFKRSVKHTILVHHNLLNALFLGDLMRMFYKKDWDLISAKDAFTDPVYDLQPNVLPAGESILWSAAKETGEYKQHLRYPAEDGEYEREKMDKLGL